ncbi:ejaculatory bulb-specific protein 3-like [Pogonomyrmex barbatus]|uniref:Ejaculatory bulb-specific protein 3-like n=1 Tax=Pogonomyrmex barbatus TaxID=144034 RepID=A0A6I9WH15_9HYME|nr:ejaculatory bulb-specific protein 3-like [Pogonomyrmex barbatus]
MSRSSLCLLAILAVVVAATAEELYSDMFDHIDPDEILPNDELRNQYYKCFMDTGPCVTEDQKFFKQHACGSEVRLMRNVPDKKIETRSSSFFASK